MAKLFRIEGLPKDQQEELRIFANQYFPNALKGKFMDSIEQTGTISPELFTEGNFSQADMEQVKSEVSRITEGMKSKRESVEGFFSGDKEPDFDEANLTDAELETRLEGYEALSGNARPIDRATFEREAETLSKSYDVNKGHFDTVKKVLADAALTGSVSAEDLIAKHKEATNSDNINHRVLNMYQDQDFINRIDSLMRSFTDNKEFGGATFGEHRKRIGDILESRGVERKKDTDIEGFISEVEGTREGETRDYLGTLEETGQERLQEGVPDVLSQVNARGGLFSGAGTDLLTSRATDFASEVSNIQSTLEAEDRDFFFNLSWQNAVRVALKEATDLKTSIASERAGVRTGQATRFSAGQNQLDRFLSLDTARRSANNIVQTQAEKLRRQADEAKRKSRSSLAGTIGQTVGTIGGTIVGSYGGPAGVVAGSTLGGTLGRYGGEALS